MPNPFDITDDVLRAMMNLKSINEPNWDKIRKWFSMQLIYHQNNASLGLHLSSDQVRQYQGACHLLFNLCGWMENPEEEIAIREKNEGRTAGPEIKIPS
jgi:hypothetical protein